MNVLIFNSQEAQKLFAQQDGKHRLSPVELTDGRWFLTEDVLTEINGIFSNRLDGVKYEIIPIDDIEPFLPIIEENI